MLHDDTALLLLVHLVWRQGRQRLLEPFTNVLKIWSVRWCCSPAFLHQLLQVSRKLFAPPAVHDIINVVRHSHGNQRAQHGAVSDAIIVCAVHCLIHAAHQYDKEDVQSLGFAALAHLLW